MRGGLVRHSKVGQLRSLCSTDGREPVFRELVTRIGPLEIAQERTGRPKPATSYAFRMVFKC